MLAYNENVGVECVAFFKDAYGNASLPTTVYYRLDCGATGNTLVDWTFINPTSVVNSSGATEVSAMIEIPGTANAIQNKRNSREVKKLLVVADKDLESEYSQEYQYLVRNIQGR